MNDAFQNRKFVLYSEIAVLILVTIVGIFGHNLATFHLMSVFGGIAIIFAAEMFTVWVFNLRYYGPRRMFLYRRILRRFHNPANNRAMNTIFAFTLFAVYLGGMSFFFPDFKFVALPVAVLVVTAWLRAGVPPFVLLLGATGSNSYKLSRRVMATIAPFTIAELLDDDAVDEEVKLRMQYEIGRSRKSIFLTNYFFPSARIVVGDDSWREAVEFYCLLASVIVFDFRKKSDHTEFEIQVINDHNLWHKAMIVGDGGNWLYRQPWYKTNVVEAAKLIPGHDDGLLVTTYLHQIISDRRRIGPENPLGRLRLRDAT